MNKFEFVVVSGERAKQLQRGCTPKVEVQSESQKPARTAMREVKERKIEKVQQE